MEKNGKEEGGGGCGYVYPRETPPPQTRTARAQPPAAHSRRHSRPNHQTQTRGTQSHSAPTPTQTAYAHSQKPKEGPQGQREEVRVHPAGDANFIWVCCPLWQCWCWDVAFLLAREFVRIILIDCEILTQTLAARFTCERWQWAVARHSREGEVAVWLSAEWLMIAYIAYDYLYLC